MSNTKTNYHSKLYCLFLCFMTGVSFVKAQSADILLKKADSVYYSDPYRSYSFCDEAEQEAIKNNHDLAKHTALLCKARFHLLVGQLSAAENELKMAIKFFKSKQEKLKLASAYNLMAVLADKRQNSADMYFYCNETIRLYKELDNVLGEYKATANLALSYLKEKKFDQAQELFKRLEPLNEKVPSSYSFYYYLNYGDLCSKIEKFKEAVPLLEKAVAISVEIKMVDSEITALTFLGRTLFDMGKTAQGISKLNSALEKALENGLKGEERDAYKVLQTIYTKQKNEAKLTEVTTRLNELEEEFKKDSVVTAQARIKMEEEKTKMEQKKKLLQAEMEKKKNKLQAKGGFFNWYVVLIIAGLVLVVVVVLFVVSKNR